MEKEEIQTKGKVIWRKRREKNTEIIRGDKKKKGTEERRLGRGRGEWLKQGSWTRNGRQRDNFHQSDLAACNYFKCRSCSAYYASGTDVCLGGL